MAHGLGSKKYFPYLVKKAIINKKLSTTDATYMVKHFLLGVLVLVIFFAAIFLSQRSLMYFPSLHTPNQKEFLAEDMELVKIPVNDGLILNSWYKPATKDKPVILYFHGNAGHIGYRMPLVRKFLDAGFGVLLLEYRGYGGNPGKPTEAGLYEDGRAAVAFLQQRGVSEKTLLFYGESLGSGVAIELATKLPVCALILQSPYTSFTDLARYHYFWVPLPVLDKFDSLSRIKNVHAPLLMLHGTKDEVVPYEEGLRLYEAANQPKKWVAFPERGHNNLWHEQFTQTVIEFINQHCASS